MKDIKMTKGYEKNQVIMLALDNACNEVKNIIIKEIVFSGYKPSKKDLYKVVQAKIKDLFKEANEEIIQNSQDSIEEMYDYNESQKVKAVLESKKQIHKYSEMIKHLDSAKKNVAKKIKLENNKIEKRVITTITNDCFSLINKPIPESSLEKVKGEIDL